MNETKLNITVEELAWYLAGKEGLVGIAMLRADVRHIPIARRMLAAEALLAALQALLDWGRDHTSPLDAHSPHLLLIEAEAAIAKAKGDAE